MPAIADAPSGTRQPVDDPVLSRGRSIFAAGLAHELRTPLTILKGRLHALEDGVIDPASGECGRLLKHVDQLLSIVDDLGTLAKVQAGELILDRRVVDVTQVISRAIGQVRPGAEAIGVGLSFAMPAPITARIDPVRMTRALVVILRFAVSRMSASAMPTLQVTVAPDLRLTIASEEFDWDAGQDAILFAPFYRSEDSAADNSGESSIGPAVGPALIQAHGGTVSIVRPPFANCIEIVITLPVE